MNEDSHQSESSARDPNWEAFARVVAGESDPAEMRSVDAWLAAHPTDVEFMACVKDHADRAEELAGASVNVESALQSVHARMGKVANERQELRVVHGTAKRGPRYPTSRTPVRPALRWQGRYVAFAAAAVAVIAVSVQRWNHSTAISDVSRTITTNIGQHDSVTLTDGTRVILAPGTVLTVSASFNSGDRTVALTGAAQFDVVHDESRPFTVRAADAVIRDIGTTFTVKTDNLGGVSVSVTHGTVAIGSADTTDGAPARVELHAGDRGTVSAKTVAVTRGIVTPEDGEWTRGVLSYRDTPLPEIQADLKRWYGITLLVEDSALAKLTVTMPPQPDQNILINTLATLLGATAEQRGDTVLLR